ncbi:MAG: DUF4982 domain-containing protein [Carboxylicivirga sp.]|jgi:beta-galactosidase|nr:DUF4982 domain-containing protein [Carboxylicivirga sp.]
MKIKNLTVFIMLVFSSNVFAQREIIDLNDDWKFHFGHAADLEKDFRLGTGTQLQFAKLEPAPHGGHGIPSTLIGFDDSAWEEVNIPHDWAVDLPYDFSQNSGMGSRHGFKPVGREFPETSIGWYRKNFEVTKADEGKRIVLDFDGVFRNCMVWVNGFYMGRHWSGYTGFNFDITDYLEYGAKNVVSVRVDAQFHEGWFYEGSGINKEVYLVKTNPIHFEDVGPYIRTKVENGNARIEVSAHIENESFKVATMFVKHQIIDAEGKLVTSGKSKSKIVNSRSSNDFEQSLEVKDPALWSDKTPTRYQLVSTLYSGGKVLDTYRTKFGIRTLQFDANKGFFLNGERCQLNGVCIHQNFAGVGSALPEALHYYRIKLLKEMGVNAVRSHYPFSKSMLNACDSLGMLVMDETRTSGGSAEALGQVKWMVTNHRNHPSIIIWSMANEEGGTQRDIIGKRYMKKMVAEANKYDSTRVVTAGVNAWNSKVDFGFSQEIDVMGFNYSLEFIDEYHKNHPEQPLFGTEVSNATTTRGFYEFAADNKAVAIADGLGGYFMPEEGEELQVQTKGHLAANMERRNGGAYKSVKFYGEREWLAGSFFWTGFDYNGEIYPSKKPNNSSQFGAMDLAGMPKSTYYYYKSWWTNEPVLNMAQHWNWPGMEGKDAEVLIHSNCDEVKLVLNGKSLGKRKIDKYGHLSWKVKYAPGKLEAIGYKNGKKVLRDKIVTAGKPAKLRLVADKTTLKADGRDVTVVRVEVLDRKGNFVPLASNQLSFEVSGDAKILGTGNGDPSSDEIDSHPSRKAFNGKAVVLIQAGKKSSELKLKVSATGLNVAELTLHSK